MTGTVNSLIERSLHSSHHKKHSVTMYGDRCSTYYGYCFSIYTDIRSLWCIPETNIMRSVEPQLKKSFPPRMSKIRIHVYTFSTLKMIFNIGVLNREF